MGRQNLEDRRRGGKAGKRLKVKGEDRSLRLRTAALEGKGERQKLRGGKASEAVVRKKITYILVHMNKRSGQGKESLRRKIGEIDRSAKMPVGNFLLV